MLARRTRRPTLRQVATRLPTLRSDDGYERWERRTETGLLWLSVAFVVVLVLPLVTHLSRPVSLALTVANIAIWAVFAADYAARLYLSRERWHFVRTHVLDLIIVLVPFLRPLRALRMLRLLRLGVVGGLINRRTASLHAKVSTYVATTATVFILLAAFAMYDTERHAPHGNIKTLSDALWWAASTVTTVGYGDRYPTTGLGRGIAVLLMVVGIALLGVITAAVAAWFVARLRTVETAEEHVDETMTEVLTELRRLHARLDAIEGQGK